MDLRGPKGHGISARSMPGQVRLRLMHCLPQADLPPGACRAAKHHPGLSLFLFKEMLSRNGFPLVASQTTFSWAGIFMGCDPGHAVYRFSPFMPVHPAFRFGQRQISRLPSDAGSGPALFPSRSGKQTGVSDGQTRDPDGE